MGAWRWRRCAACNAVCRAGELITRWDFRSDAWRGDLERECPRCGFVGRTSEFPVIRERHPAEVSS
jgi:hypothetical protein